MRRALLVLAIALTVVLTVAMPADAFKRGFHHGLSGDTVVAAWFAPDAFTSIVVTQSGGHTLVEGVDSVFERDADGNVVSVTDTELLPAESGFAFTFRQPLAGAVLTAEGLPAIACTYDPNSGDPGICTNTSVNLEVAWTGEGPISRGAQTFHIKGDVTIENIHAAGQSRAATATGEFDGRTLGAAFFTLFATVRTGDVFVCYGPDIIFCSG